MISIFIKTSFPKKLFAALLFVIFFCFTQTLFSQNNFYSITGKAVTKDNKPIEFGNIIALSIKDSSIIKGVPFQNGIFKLEGAF
jgi:hypothetical protein